MSKNSCINQLSLLFDVPASFADSRHRHDTAAPAEALYSLLGPMGHRLREIFHRMQLAEEVIEEMKRLNPRHRDLIHNTFGLLYGTAVLEEAPERLYIAHCQELIHRVIEEGDTRVATISELIAAIRGVSLITPLKRHAVYLYWELFQILFPDEASGVFGGNDPVMADEWDKRQAGDLRTGLLAKLADPNRTLKAD